MPTPTPILATTNWDEYRRLRVILRKHQNAAVKTISGTTFRKCAKTFGMLDGKKLMLESDTICITGPTRTSVRRGTKTWSGPAQNTTPRSRPTAPRPRVSAAALQGLSR
jgi:hypothetical protein